MPIDTPVDPSNDHSAPADGMARFLASRQAKPTPAAKESEPADKSGEGDEPPASEPQPTGEETPAAAAAAASPEAVIDPETEQPITNPTRNDRRIAKLWKREQDALKEVERLRLLLEDRNAASVLDSPQTAGRPDSQAPSDAEALTAAAKARIRPEPAEGGIGTTYPTYEAFVKDCAIWGGELAAEKRAILDQQAQFTAQANATRQKFQQAYAEQSALYPDFGEKISAAAGVDLGPVITDVITNTPDLAGHLTYWAATQTTDVARIRALAPGPQLVEMGKVMAGLKLPAAKASNTTKTTSRAPAPTVEIGGPAGRASSRLEDATNFSEFAARRESQIAARRRVR